METDLTLMPAVTLAFALGMCAGGPQRPEQAGRISMLSAELRRRGVYADMVAQLDPSLQRRLAVLEIADTGQAMNKRRYTG